MVTAAMMMSLHIMQRTMATIIVSQAFPIKSTDNVLREVLVDVPEGMTQPMSPATLKPSAELFFGTSLVRQRSMSNQSAVRNSWQNLLSWRFYFW